MVEKYEVVVVGGGIAGLSAAYELARNGVQVLVLERGKDAGRKNVSGGVLYGQANTEFNLDYLFPNFREEAPLERFMRKYEMFALAGDKAKQLDLARLHEHEMKWAYSILRTPFDRWLADQVHKEARKHGGGVVTDVRVKGPIFHESKIVGVATDELEDVHAEFIIAADGATSEMVRGAGLRGWGEPEQWFQGVKAVLKVKDLEQKFGLSGPQDGAAYLYAGDVFQGVRGGGFLYTNKDSLSVGTVFHLDALADAKVEPHRLLDKLLTHPSVANLLGNDYEEVEYSAKLIPDGKKMGLKVPARDRMVVIGDAAGHMQAQGPVIKGLNLGISAGVIAAQAFVRAWKENAPSEAAHNYVEDIQKSYVWTDLRPLRYRMFGKMGEKPWADRLATRMAQGSLGRMFTTKENRVKWLFSSPFLAGMMPDTNLGYTLLPTLVAKELGSEVAREAKVEPKSLDDRIGSLRYDTDIGKAHIVLTDNSPAASGRAVHTCPVSSRQSSRGCYSLVTVGAKQVVALDTQPCIECGTCAIMAATNWETPRGGKGVDYQRG